MSSSEWRCDRSIYSNPPDVNNNVPPSEDQSRPWKNYKVPAGSTVGEVLSHFGQGARQQFLKGAQAKASEAGFSPGSLAVYHGILKSTPVRTKLGVLVESSFNQTFRPSRREPLSIEIVKEARSGTSSRYKLTKEGDLRISLDWHTQCGSCEEQFKTGDRVVKMIDGSWRHYWQYPIYGESFSEIIDVYKEKSEDGMEMRDGSIVWMDITRTRFEVEGEREGTKLVSGSRIDSARFKGVK